MIQKDKYADDEWSELQEGDIRNMDLENKKVL